MRRQRVQRRSIGCPVCALEGSAGVLSPRNAIETGSWSGRDASCRAAHGMTGKPQLGYVVVIRFSIRLLSFASWRSGGRFRRALGCDYGSNPRSIRHSDERSISACLFWMGYISFFHRAPGRLGRSILGPDSGAGKSPPASRMLSWSMAGERHDVAGGGSMRVSTHSVLRAETPASPTPW